MIDYSPYFHAGVAVIAQLLFGLVLGDWFTGGAFGCLWFLAREHTQAEYRWIAKFGGGKRANMSWWGGFDWRAWGKASMLDWVVPVLACSLVYIVSSLI